MVIDSSMKSICVDIMEKPIKKIILTFSFDSEQQADHIARCLKPEIQKDISQVTIHLTQEKEELRLEFSTMQTPILRAAINSYIRWIETAYSVHSL